MVKPLSMVFLCIGRHIVTIEIEEVIAGLTQDFPDLRFDEARFEHSPMFTNLYVIGIQIFML
jgi:cytochrome P450